MFAPPSNVYYFYYQPTLQACVCYAQLSYCTGSKFKVYWLTLLCRRYYIYILLLIIILLLASS